MRINSWPTSNFGDCLNDWIWPYFLPNWREMLPHCMLVGIGSLLNHRLPRDETKVILGSGFGHGEFPEVDERYRFVWVRGPRTSDLIQRRCGISVPWISDPALLLAKVARPMINGGGHAVSYVPHCSARNSQACWAMLKVACEQAGIHLIDIYGPRETVVSEIANSGRVLTEALHGAVVADAFRVPWTALARPGVFEFKWLDWCESMSLPYRPVAVGYSPSWYSRPSLKSPLKSLAKVVLGRRALPQTVSLLKRLRESTGFSNSREDVLNGRIGSMIDAIREFADSAMDGSSFLRMDRIGVGIGSEKAVLQ